MTKNYAVLNGDTVINVIVADSITIAKKVTGKECIECDGSFWIGWTRTDDAWIAPVVETVVDEA